MTPSDFLFRFRLTVVAIAVCSACLPAQAQTKTEETKVEETKAEEPKKEESKAEEPEEEDSKAEVVRPDQTTVSAGVGFVDGSRADRALFGQYNGVRNDRNLFGLLDLEYSLRNPEALSWVDFQGSNLLLDTRELHLVWKKPGQWKFTANYGELTHVNPYMANTGLIGAGSTTPQVVPLLGGPGTGSEYELKTKRTGLGVGFAQHISPAWQYEIDLKTEKKEGSRLFGIGMNCPSPIAAGCARTTGINTGWAVLMLPEPVDSNHSQVEARLHYAREKLRLSVGYYGSYYRNANSSLNPTIPGGRLNNTLGSPLPLSAGLQGLLQQPVALSPDNQAHQLDLSGSYAFTDKTRGTFKLGYTRATQDDDFTSAGLTGAPAGVTDLGGKITTKLARVGITSRPMPKLSLLADLRYEDKDDQTPLAKYNFVDATTSFTNRHLPNRKTSGKLQANWQFNSEYRGTLGANYEAIDRGVFTATSAVSGLSALRQETQESGVRAELRRRMTENFSGAITVSHSRRDGSNWLRNNSGLGVTEVSNPADPMTGFLPSAIFMPSLADRERDKVRLFADWQPSEKLTLQFSAEGGQDKFSTPSVYGLRNSRTNQFGVDWSYAQSYAWNFNGYASHGVQTFDQSRFGAYVMAFENTNLSAGVGFTGKVSGKIEVGGNLSYHDDKSSYNQTLDTFAGTFNAAVLAASGGLPDVTYRQTALKLFGKYALDKRSAVRVDLVHQRAKMNDWTWGYNGVPFTYSDGTTLTQKQSQSVSFIGITYVYQLQ